MSGGAPQRCCSWGGGGVSLPGWRCGHLPPRAGSLPAGAGGAFACAIRRMACGGEHGTVGGCVHGRLGRGGGSIGGRRRSKCTQSVLVGSMGSTPAAIVGSGCALPRDVMACSAAQTRWCVMHHLLDGPAAEFVLGAECDGGLFRLERRDGTPLLPQVGCIVQCGSSQHDRWPACGHILVRLGGSSGPHETFSSAAADIAVAATAPCS